MRERDRAPGTSPGHRNCRRFSPICPLYVAQAVDVALSSRRLAGGDVTSERLAEEPAALADLLRDRPALAATVKERRLVNAVGGHGALPGGGPEWLLPAARRLAGRDDFAAQLLATGLLRTGGPAAGWSGEWRSLLDGLRRSAHLEVGQAAWDIRLPVTRPGGRA